MPDQPSTLRPVARITNRTQIISGLIIFIFLSSVLIEFEAFEAVHEFSRDHEDWELDELIMALLAAIVTSAYIFAYSTFRYSNALQRELEHRIKLEQELAHAQKLQSLGTLAGGVAHSTNNYLQPIQTLSRLAKKQLPEESPLQTFMDKILQAANSAQEVLDQLLRFAHQDNREVPRCDLKVELKDHQLLYRSAIGNAKSLEFDLPETPCSVALSTSQISDILLALITNAEDSYNGGQGPIKVLLQHNNQTASLSVIDQGCGMSAEQQQRIFEPFYTSKAVGQGTGLGLSIVHSLVQQQGGEIQVQSTPDMGTCFTILLPMVKTDL